MPAMDLHVGLLPAKHVMRAEARFSLVPQAAGLKVIRLRLHPGLKVSRVDLNWKPVRHSRQGEWLEIKLGAYTPGKPLALTVGYAGRPYEKLQGHRRQDLGPEGLMLHPEGRWFPAPEGARPAKATVRLVVPAHWRALAPAAKQEFDRGPQAYRLTFQNQPLAIAASHLRAYPVSGLTAYLRPAGEAGARPAAASAWNAAAAELARAQSVLEMFRAHGVGGAKLSGTIVELPADFAPLDLGAWEARPQEPGGLGRSLLTAQWGLSAGATPLERQWLSAGLAAYSDDLLAERRGGQAGYRQAVAKRRAAYEAFLDAHPTQDVAIDRAIAPGSVAWHGVVANKGAFVWAQLREAMGDPAFWAMLRAYQAGLATNRGGWAGFEAAAGPAAGWAHGWLTRPGLPSVKLRDVAVTEVDGVFQVTGHVASDENTPPVGLELALVAADEVQRVKFQTFGPEAPFHFVTSSKPLRLMLDPNHERPLRRRAHLIMPQGAVPADGLIVYGTQGGADEAAANEQAARAMQERLKRSHHVELPIKADVELSDEDRKHSLLLFGRPGTNAITDELADQFPVRFMPGNTLWWQGRTYGGPEMGTVQIVANPADPEQTVVLFAALSAKGMADTVQFSQAPATFCIFSSGRLIEQGKALNTFPDLDAVLY
jgi:hypothetical protein